MASNKDSGMFFSTAAGNGTGGQAYTGPCNLTKILVGTDDTNDVTVNIYDNTAAAGDKVIPQGVVKADYQGWQGFTGSDDPANIGLHVSISGIGTGEVKVSWNTKDCF